MIINPRVLKVESGDGLSIALDEGKGIPHAPPLKIFSSYWDEWKAKQQTVEERTDDLFLKYLLGQGDRPDIGAGIAQMSTADSISFAKKENSINRTQGTF